MRSLKDRGRGIISKLTIEQTKIEKRSVTLPFSFFLFFSSSMSMCAIEKKKKIYIYIYIADYDVFHDIIMLLPGSYASVTLGSGTAADAFISAGNTSTLGSRSWPSSSRGCIAIRRPAAAIPFAFSSLPVSYSRGWHSLQHLLHAGKSRGADRSRSGLPAKRILRHFLGLSGNNRVCHLSTSSSIHLFTTEYRIRWIWPDRALFRCFFSSRAHPALASSPPLSLSRETSPPHVISRSSETSLRDRLPRLSATPMLRIREKSGEISSDPPRWTQHHGYCREEESPLDSINEV